MRADRCPDEKIVQALRHAAVGFALVGALTALSGIDAQSAVSIDCPLEGDAKSTMVRTLNRLKNRTAAPVRSDLDTAVTMKVLTAPGDDRNRFSMRRAAMLQGYVVDVKVGGIESTNCHAKDPIDRDTHIETEAGNCGSTAVASSSGSNWRHARARGPRKHRGSVS